MKDNEYQMKIQTEKEKEALQFLNRNYHKPEMSDEQLKNLQLKIEEAKSENKRKRVQNKWIKFAATAAAFIMVFIMLPNTSPSIAYAMEQIPVLRFIVKAVTFRDYKYEDTRHRADIDVAKLKVEQITADKELQKKLEHTIDNINEEVEKITDEIIEHFETYMHDEMGYQDIMVKSEVLKTTQNYFTLKLMCYQGSGSGYQWNYYYTIDLTTGERLELKDIFKEKSDYTTRISNDIKRQMREQMAADENNMYWLDSEIDGWNFKTITEETSFYINEKDNIVICFNEGDVAPMYMGTVEFEIPSEVVSDIRK